MKQQDNLLEQGICLNGQAIDFMECRILDYFSIVLPEDWRQMPAEFAQIKYPTEPRPQWIMTSGDLSVNMGFTIFTDELPDDDIKGMTEQVMAVIAQEHPEFEFYQFAQIGEPAGYWFSFRSRAMDSDLFNQMLLTPINGRIIMVNFNCLHRECTDWEQTILMIWETIEALHEEGTKDESY